MGRDMNSRSAKPMIISVALAEMMANVEANPQEVAEIDRLNRIQDQAEAAKLALVFQMSLRGATQNQPKAAN